MPTLILSKNSLKNNTLDCDALGIHFQVSTAAKVTTLSRWNSRSGGFDHIGEWEHHRFKEDAFRLSGENEFVAVSKRFPRSSSRWRGGASFTRKFIGYSGQQFQWKASGRKLTAYACDDMPGEKGSTIAEAHMRNLVFKRQNARIELYPGFETVLDILVLTFLYAEWKRRAGKRSRNAAIASGGASAGA